MEMFVLNFCFDGLQWINPRPRDTAPPVRLFISRLTAYDASIQVNISPNKYAPITIISSMVWFRNQTIDDMIVIGLV